ncbi:MAG: hypothetical protein JSW05_06010, partial [Candidatus Thorarchaeota archaeon]
IFLDVAEHNVKVVTELDPKELWDVYRMEGINPDGPEDAQRIMRELVDRFVKENPETPNPRVYVLPDAGLLVEVKNRSR